MSSNLFSYNTDPQYPDRYNRSTGWIRVLPVPGRPLQTAELTEMQSILHDNSKQFMDSLFRNGSPIRGLRASLVNSTSTSDSLSVVVSSGVLYVEGVLVDVEGATLSVPSTGTHTIGVLISESIITEKEDPSLRDPIKGGALYGLEGASRLVWSTALVVDNSNSYVIAQISDGSLTQLDLNPLYAVTDQLARYTTDRLGNFCVSGYDVSSVATSSRAITDRAKYSALQAASDSATSSLQVALSDAQAAKLTLDSLKTQYDNALSLSTISPSPTNLARTADLSNRLADAQSRYNDLSNQVVVKETLKQSAASDLSRAASLLVDKHQFTISPGVAYVEGYRICKSTPTIVEVPKDLPVSTVQSARFTYEGSPSRAIRQLLITGPYGWSDVLTDSTTLQLTFQSLLYQNSSLDITVTLSTVGSSDLASFLSFVVASLNDTSDTISSRVTYTCSNPSLTATQIRAVLKNNLVISSVGPSNTSLQVVSTSLNERSNQIGLAVTSNVVTPSPLAGSGKLVADIPSSNLSGGGTTTSFQLGFRPVSEVIRVVAELQQDLKPINRGTTPGTSDVLGDDSIFRIVTVVQGTTTFIENVDYRLINQSQIDWSPSGGNEPAPGTTYYVSFLYTQPLAANDDYVLDTSTDSIRFVGRTPAVVYVGGTSVYNGSFTVDYSYYLSKAGLIYLDRDGQFSWAVSAASQSPVAPTLPANVLPVASFVMAADSVSISPVDCKRLSAADQKRLVDSVQANTSAIETLKLDLEAYRKATSEVTPIGLYSDSIQDLSKLDITNAAWTAAVSPITQSLTAGYTHRDVLIRTTGNPSPNESGAASLWCLPWTPVQLLSQGRITSTRGLPAKVKPHMYLSSYSSFSCQPLTGISGCDYLIGYGSSNSSDYVDAIQRTVSNLFGSMGDKLAASLVRNEAVSVSAEQYDEASFLGYLSKVKAAPITVLVTVEGLAPNSDNYGVFLQSREVSTFVPQSNTPLSLAYPGRLKAKADGSLSFLLTVTPSLGVNTIEVQSPNLDQPVRARLSAFNNLLDQVVLGALSSWTKTLLPINPSGLTPIDPWDSGNSIYHYGLTECLSIPYECCVSSLVIHLRTGSISTPMNAYLLDKQGSLLARATTSSYQYSDDGSLPTELLFRRPIPVSRSQYSIALESPTPGYTLFTSELGGTPLPASRGSISNQLYLGSSLSLDGNVLPYEDLTFSVSRASFSPSLTVDLGTYGVSDGITNITHFCLNTRDVLPRGTSITYEYEDGDRWSPFIGGRMVCLPSTKASLHLRATLASTNEKLSPFLLLEGLTVSLYSSNLTSAVISKPAIYEDPYTGIAITLRYVKPPEASLTVKYSPTQGFPWEGTEWLDVPLDVSSTRLVDPTIQLYESTYRRQESSPYYVLTNPRTRFRYQVIMTTTDRCKQALISNVITYVH